MTTYTIARHTTVIKSRDRPFACCVAAVAIGLGCNVVGRFPAASDPIVTRYARSRRSLENPAFVARVASGFDMRAGERKTGRKMVEFRCGRCRRNKASSERGCKHDRQECRAPPSDHTDRPSKLKEESGSSSQIALRTRETATRHSLKTFIFLSTTKFYRIRLTSCHREILAPVPRLSRLADNLRIFAVS